jgi:hypothetical protein
MRVCALLAFFISLLSQSSIACQATDSLNKKDTSHSATRIRKGSDSVKQLDVIDIIHRMLKKDTNAVASEAEPKFNLSFIPAAGYTLSTGLVVGVSAVGAFYTQKDHSLNMSIVNAQALHDARGQSILFIESNLWADQDNYKLVSDFRIEKYPDVTYGLGDTTTTHRPDPITYNYLRLYQTVLRKVVPHLYVGIGYDLDVHYNIVEDIVQAKNKKKQVILTEYEIYAGVKTTTSPTTISSGYTFNFLYDTRSNPQNALTGTFIDLIFSNNYMFLGSNVDYSTAIFDIRKYFKFSKHSNNVLAIWNYNWFTLDGKPPYLDLPSVGADMYNNTGRGYTINRFRGKHMIYLEAEYRFGITRNGLLGGVIFGNAANYSTNITSSATSTDGLQNIIPAGGGGIRLKINKHSNTNLCIDYGFGIQGSRGFFVNLGEVF